MQNRIKKNYVDKIQNRDENRKIHQNMIIVKENFFKHKNCKKKINELEICTSEDEDLHNVK